MSEHLSEPELLKRQVDQLIDAYESGAYRKGGSVVQVRCDPAHLTFALKTPDGLYHYRGRILQPIVKPKPTPRKRDQMDAWK